ncbi:WD40-repeat-containing domain protein [Amanita muscaria]
MPDGQRLLVGNEEGLIKSWRIPKQGRSADTFDFECKAHFGAVQAFTFSPNEKYFASASNDGSICVWDSTSVDLHEPELTHTSAPHRQTVTFAPDGQAVAVDTSNTISKVNATTGRSIFDKENGLYHCRDSLLFSADGKYLASGGIQELLVWDTESTSCKWGRHIETHAFSPNATYYVMLFSTGHLWIHDLLNGESRKLVSTNRRAAFSEIRFSYDSRHIGSLNGEFCVFDVEKGVQVNLDFPASGKCQIFLVALRHAYNDLTTSLSIVKSKVVKHDCA